jgi:nicotinate-nucleotide pyrophosphorylase (carboxylating)
MLDNFEIEMMVEAVELAAGRVVLEVSGNVDLHNITSIAATGVDFISVGALTKHIRAIDMSLRIRDSVGAMASFT